jgi:hypothetical protein
VTKLTYSVTEMEMALAFAEWDRRFRADPAGFQSTAERLIAGERPERYGERTADFFVRLLEGKAGDEKRSRWFR